MIKSKEINDKNIKKDEEDNSDAGNYLNYLKITGLNKIEEVDNDAYIQQCIMFSSTLAQENENNIGQEINKFFNLILTENKEGEPLKVNIAISNRYLKEKNMGKPIDFILNKNFESELVLNEEMSENIALVLTTIFQKIQNKNKFNSFTELVQKVNGYSLFEKDILKDYLIDEDDIRNRQASISPVKPDYEINRFLSTSPSKSKRKDSNQNDPKKNISVKQKTKTSIKRMLTYEFKEKKSDNDLQFPIEMLIIKRKFLTIKKLKLMISDSKLKKHIFDTDSSSEKNNSYVNISFSSNISETNLKAKDVQNIIFVLLNIDWLFPTIIEIEIDLSNDNIIKDQISLYKSSLKYFSKILKRSIKNTDYSQNKIKKINYDPLHASIFDNYVQQEETLNEESYTSSGDYSLKVQDFQEEENLFSWNNIDNKKSRNIIEDNQITDFDNLIQKYQSTFQMIIMYAFFIFMTI